MQQHRSARGARPGHTSSLGGLSALALATLAAGARAQTPPPAEGKPAPPPAAAKPASKPAPKPNPAVPPPNPPPPVPAALAAKVKLEVVTRDTSEAVGLVAAPGEPTGRMFVVEKKGLVRTFDLRTKTFATEPFLDLTGKVALDKRDGGEQGLLGLAFHPKWKSNGRFFINYTDLKGDTRVEERRADPRTGRVDATFARELLFADQPFGNHNAGNLAFGPDGRLYVLLGDGGAADDPHGNGQNPKSLLGKMIRIDVDAKGNKAPAPEVVGKGMRNPWRYSFDRKTGDLYIADVGQRVWEWINVVPKAKLGGPHNFGWNVTEGNHCFGGKTDAQVDCKRDGLTAPALEYAHSEGCSISGGYVYRGKALPELQGHYFFTDYCTAILRSFRFHAGKAADSWDWKAALDPESTLAKLVAFGEDQDGELYLVSHEGPIYKLAPK
jgi:glucose/arabinose dehydrogenase